MKEKLILTCNLCPGDLVTLTAAVRDLHAAHPGKYLTDVRTPHPDLWLNNPHITRIPDGEGRVIEMHYPLIGRSNQTPHHFIHGYRKHLESELGVSIEAGDFKGDIHLSDEERGWLSQVEEIRGAGARFWIIVSGGKSDFTAKHWDAARWQAVVNAFPELQFVQVGEAKDMHPPLKGVLDLRGKTSLRQLIRLVYHSDGVLCPVTSLMHLAAAVPRKHGTGLRPCVVVAGGREPSHWEAYPGHKFLDTIGQLPCCSTGGCWKSRVWPLGDGDGKDNSLCERPVTIREGVHIPGCLDRITAQHVIDAMRGYLMEAPPVVVHKKPEPKPCAGCGDKPPVIIDTDPKSWGPHKWREWHGRTVSVDAIRDLDPKAEAHWLAEFIHNLPCPDCRKDFLGIVMHNQPRFQSMDAYRAWGIEIHNAVNAKLGKPVLTQADGEAAIERNRSRRHAEIHERGAVCRVCEYFSPATAEHGPICQRNGNEPLKVKIQRGTCDKWPGYVEPVVKDSLATAADVPATSFGNKVGVVIGTYGAVPYIHLQLESLRRFHPATPVLVVDDCSPHWKELADLCWRYGAEFVCNPERMNHARGDMQAFIEGHEWAADEEIGLLVKLSRRWIPIAPWIDEAVELWERTAATTLCNISTAHGFGFRSECVAMDVAAWDAANACQVLHDHIKASASQPGDLDVGASGMLVEHIVHVAAAAAKTVSRWESELNFEPWPFMTTSRHGRIPGVLWHEGSPTSAYLEQLRAWGINDYTLESLLDAKANLHLNR